MVNGLTEASGENAKDEDEDKTKQLLTELGVEESTVKRKSRLRKTGQEVDNSKPSHLLIEFYERETAEKAISNAKKLVKTKEFNKVYVNRDKTEAVRVAEANLRKQRNERNKQLPFVMDDGRGLRYGVDDKTNKKFYWGIRNGELARVLINDKTSKTREGNAEMDVY